MTEKTLKQSKEDMLYTLKAEFRLEKSVETALYNFLVNDKGEVLSNQDFLGVLRAFNNWVINQDHQPTFAVGEYYSFTTYRKDNDADTTFIFKTLETKNSGIRVIEYDCHGKNYEEYVYDIDSDFLNDSMPATAEQIADFKRAEHFAAHGRKLDEFRVGDKVNCSEIPFDNGYYTGEVVIQGFGKKTFVAGLEKGLHLYNLDDLNKITLIQTAEELREVEG